MGRRVQAALAACALAGSLPNFVEGFVSSGASGFGRLALQNPRRATSLALTMADSTMPNKKVVVTGVGAVTAIGMGADEFFTKLFKGDHGFGPLPAWADEFPCKTGATLKNFKAEDWYENKKEAKRQSRYMHMGVAASKMGLKDAGLEKDQIADKSRFGMLIGSAIGGSEYYEEASNKWGKFSEYEALKTGAKWGDETFAGRNGIYKGPMFMDDSK